MMPSFDSHVCFGSSPGRLDKAQANGRFIPLACKASQGCATMQP
ncbi:MAG: hypothetical protein WC762_12020 [Methylobacter sp.]